MIYTVLIQNRRFGTKKYPELKVSATHYDERPTRDQKDTGSLIHLGMLFLAYIKKNGASAGKRKKTKVYAVGIAL